ncbi:MAG: RNA-binding S4 domain-containing protein [Desulfobulbaceae bacterium]|nr:RNA-binding S4 domain-containing protein [Desulfobulbaceae bacterium]
MHDSGDDDRVRIDKWLWAARFFKTRAQAAQAVGGGRVHIGGERVKSSRPLKVGDLLEITREEERWAVEVVALAERRGPASVARELYRESEESIKAREKQREERRLRAVGPGQLPARRPGKRDRRLIKRFIRGDDAE